MVSANLSYAKVLRWGGATLLLAGLVVLLWWAFWRTEVQYETEPVRWGDVEQAVTALGVLQPQRYVDVGAQVSGQIQRIAVTPGDVVGQGDLLVEIDPALQLATVKADRASLQSLHAQLAEQQAERDLARQRLSREQHLSRRDASSAEKLQEAQAQLRVAQARIASLQAQIEGAQSTLEGNEALLGYTRLYAPMDGTVVTLEAREGQTLNATYQTPNLLRLADLQHMTVWTQVSEADVGRVRPGMPVYFTTMGLVDAAGAPRRWQGVLRQILPAPPVSTETGGQAQAAAGKVVSYTALFDVDNADGALMPQMSARVFFVSASAQQVLLAPLSVLQPTEEVALYTAQVLQDGKPQPRTVRLGVRDRLYGEVLSGLEEGDMLVTGVQETRGSTRLRW